MLYKVSSSADHNMAPRFYVRLGRNSLSNGESTGTRSMKPAPRNSHRDLISSKNALGRSSWVNGIGEKAPPLSTTDC